MRTGMPSAQTPPEQQDVSEPRGEFVEAFRIDFNRCVIQRETATTDKETEPHGKAQ